MADAVEVNDPRELLASSIGPACHELRGPLAASYGFARMLESSAALDETARRYVGQVVDGCQRLDDMLDSLASIGRIATGRVNPEVAHVVVREAAREAAGRVHAGDVAVTAPDDVVALADRAWLVDALTLLFDALCYDESLHATCEVEHVHDRVTVAVRARGPLPPADTEVGRCSLAIALARMQVMAMGGEVRDVDGGVDLLLRRP